MSAISFLSGINGVDADSDDELVVARANRGDGIYKLKFETFNILSGAAEEEFSVTAKNTRVFK